MTMSVVVYQVTNMITGQQYVGITRFTSAHRWTQHVYKAKSSDSGSWFHRAIAKYGRENFVVEDLMCCLRMEDAWACEQDAIKQIQPAYNRTNGGEFTVGRRVAPEVAERIKAANTGKKRTPEQNAAMSAIKKAQYAADPEQREAIAERLTEARKLISEAKRIEAVRQSQLSRVWSDESRAKLSASCMGRRYGKDVIDRIRATKNKRVECTSLATVFDSVLDAGAACGIHYSTISKVCRGTLKSAHGLKFQFV